ncbi:MAG: hypothetical protein R6V55_04695 [Desulfovermiculus sp.]
MARPLRIEYPGAVYHVLARGNARSPIYLDDADRGMFLNVLGRVVSDLNWLLSQFAEQRQEARMQFRHFVLAGEQEESIWKDLRGQCRQRFLVIPPP